MEQFLFVQISVGKIIEARADTLEEAVKSLEGKPGAWIRADGPDNPKKVIVWVTHPGWMIFEFNGKDGDWPHLASVHKTEQTP